MGRKRSRKAAKGPSGTRLGAKLQKAAQTAEKPLCPYCGDKADLTDSDEVYGRSYGPIWLCRPCWAYVGCHPGTTKPLGTPADAETRQARKDAHYYFDYLWKMKMQAAGIPKGRARTKAYAWLAGELGIKPDECHISWFDKEQCDKVVAICRPHCDRIKQKREGTSTPTNWPYCHLQ